MVVEDPAISRSVAGESPEQRPRAESAPGAGRRPTLRESAHPATLTPHCADRVDRGPVMAIDRVLRDALEGNRGPVRGRIAPIIRRKWKEQIELLALAG